MGSQKSLELAIESGGRRDQANQQTISKIGLKPARWLKQSFTTAQESVMTSELSLCWMYYTDPYYLSNPQAAKDSPQGMGEVFKFIGTAPKTQYGVKCPTCLGRFGL